MVKSRRRHLVFAVFFTLSFVLLTGTAQTQGPTPPDRVVSWADAIWINGKIITLDDRAISSNPGTIAQAMAVRDGKILAVGTNEEITRLKGPNTKVFDLKGKTVLPGIVESHVHSQSTMRRMFEKEFTPPGLHIGIRVEATPEETLKKVQRELRQVSAQRNEWVFVRLHPNPKAGVPDIAAVSAWVTTRRPEDQKIKTEDLTRLLPQNPATLESGRGPSMARAGEVIRVERTPAGELRVTKIRGGSSHHEGGSSHHQGESSSYAEEEDDPPGYHSHRIVLLNRLALELSEKKIPRFGQLISSFEEIPNAGERGMFGASPVVSGWIETMFLAGVPTPKMAQMFKAVLHRFSSAGITAFGSRIDTGAQISAYYYLLREEGRLPVRYAYSMEMHRGLIPADFTISLYPLIGATWKPMKQSPWLWRHGVSSEGAWDSVQRGCFGPDLEAPEAVRKRQACPAGWRGEPGSKADARALFEALKSGWRIIGLHGVGSHGLRLFSQLVEEAIKESPNLSLETVRKMRLGMAHGTVAGKVPEVIDRMKHYNIYVPINVKRALEDEPEGLIKNYGPGALRFLAPVKSLLQAGVKVVGEAEESMPDPRTYFEVLDTYVRREVGGKKWVLEEGVDRVTALKLFTLRSAEFLHAEDLIGSLEPGKLADFIVIERDYLAGPDEEISKNKVLLTVVGGEIVYRDTRFSL